MVAELFDTHCHLNLAESFPDPSREIERAAEAGVGRFCLVGIDDPSNEAAVEIAERHASVFAIVGCHPNSSAQFDEPMLRRIGDLARHPKVVAVGEIGLDFHWDFATPAQQDRSLRAQLDLAAELQKPVVFHCRKAYDELLDVLESLPTRPYLFHCFTGDPEHARRVRSMDGWIGVDGPLTYKKSDELRGLCRTWPRDRLVLETDSPYLSPEPVRGKPNHPANLPLVNEALALCWGVDPEESAAQTTANALSFFGLAESAMR